MTETSTAFSTVAREPSLVEKVANELSEAIITGRLTRGTRLPSERDLGDQFGVSRTVIREAVRSLAARGLVAVTSGRGVEVVGVDARAVVDSLRLFLRGTRSFDVRQIIEMRGTVEVATAGYAAIRATEEDRARLAELCEEHERLLAAGDIPAASRVDFEFHRALAAASGNDLFLVMLDSVGDMLREMRDRAYDRKGVGESGLREHREILGLVDAKDEQGARAAMAKHLAQAESVYEVSP
jgi:GntR family transcriptional repressor for pyruvate dehydrogenase complex